MGERRVMQEALFYGFSLERRVPDNHLLRKIDRFVDLCDAPIIRRFQEPPRPFPGERSAAQAVRDYFSPDGAGEIMGSLAIPMTASCRWSGHPEAQFSLLA
jgi:hypothetical protein